MKIELSTDWAKVESKLVSKCYNLVHYSDIRRMIKNVTSEVKELSKAEVQARQGRKARAIELLAKINQDIEMIEQYILVATIIG